MITPVSANDREFLFYYKSGMFCCRQLNASRLMQQFSHLYAISHFPPQYNFVFEKETDV